MSRRNVRLLVCGGRDYADREAVFKALDYIHERRVVTCIIEGGAKGADALAREWAESRKIPHQTFNADWKTHGRAAGPKRNTQMLKEGKPTAVVAFPGGPGTMNMIMQAVAAGVPVWEPYSSGVA